LSALTTANIIGVEACYGAKFIDLTENKSCLLSALAAKTIALMGASRIAYGPPDPPIGLADVMVGHFLASVANGKTVGESHRAARLELFSEACDDAHARLTVLEFNLFGDPTYRAFAPNTETKNAITGKCDARLKHTSPLSPASLLRQSIQNSVDASRSQMTKPIRSVDLATEISAEARHNLMQCTEIAARYLQNNFPNYSPSESAAYILQIGDSRKIIHNYSSPIKTKGFVKGISLRQDFNNTDIEAVFLTK
jgi:hypothetical protein